MKTILKKIKKKKKKVEELKQKLKNKEINEDKVKTTKMMKTKHEAFKKHEAKT